MWKYLSVDDINTWVKYTPSNLNKKLKAQSRAKIPMLKESYDKLKNQYGQD